jgi:hypothetical protein
MRIGTALLRTMSRTAAALSGAPVLIRWDVIEGADGYCTSELLDGAYHIGINPRRPIGRIYFVLLHEAAHAALNVAGMRLPDQEHAARELAGVWAGWIARRKPVNIGEALAWLMRLQNYHRDVIDPPRRFRLGKNAGRILPGVKI